MVTNAIDQLVKYGMEKHLIQPADEIFVRNQLLLTMGLDEYTPSEDATPLALHEMLEVLTQNAVERGICQDNGTARELFDTKLMGCLTPWPSVVRHTFEELYNKSAEAAMAQIDLKDYPSRFALSGLPIVKVGINFDGERHTLKDWLIERM